MKKFFIFFTSLIIFLFSCENIHFKRVVAINATYVNQNYFLSFDTYPFNNKVNFIKKFDIKKEKIPKVGDTIFYSFHHGKNIFFYSK